MWSKKLNGIFKSGLKILFLNLLLGILGARVGFDSNYYIGLTKYLLLSTIERLLNLIATRLLDLIATIKPNVRMQKSLIANKWLS